MSTRYGTPEQRFWANVKKSDGCWEWLGYRVRGRYGQMYAEKRRRVYAHRFSWELHFGPIPSHDSFHGLCVCHRCDNPGCVNPEHLFLGTNEENIADRNRKGRTQRGYGDRQRGEENPSAKLTEPEVRAIRESGDRLSDIAERFGIGVSTASLIRNRHLWTHVE